MSKIPMFPNKFAILASILGAADYLTQGDFSDFNNIPHNSFATIFITSTAQNAPIEAYVSGIQLYYNSNKVIQIVFEYFSNDKIYVRQKTNNDWSDWRDWKKITCDLPSFYKNYNSISGLWSGLKTARAGDEVSISLSSPIDVYVGYGVFIIEDTTSGGNICVYVNSADDGISAIYQSQRMDYTVTQGTVHSHAHIASSSSAERNIKVYAL